MRSVIVLLLLVVSLRAEESPPAPAPAPAAPPAETPAAPATTRFLIICPDVARTGKADVREAIERSLREARKPIPMQRIRIQQLVERRPMGGAQPPEREAVCYILDVAGKTDEWSLMHALATTGTRVLVMPCPPASEPATPPGATPAR